MFSYRRLFAAVATACALAGCAGGSSGLHVPSDAQRQASFCNIYFSVGRSAQSSRRVETTQCSDGYSPTDPMYFDVQSFQEIIDATQGADPCYAPKRRCGDDQYSMTDTIIADPGGPAKRGDNCTTVPGYAIGYALGLGTGGNTLTAPGQPVPASNSTTTIVNQSQTFKTSAAYSLSVGSFTLKETVRGSSRTSS